MSLRVGMAASGGRDEAVLMPRFRLLLGAGGGLTALASASRPALRSPLLPFIVMASCCLDAATNGLAAAAPLLGAVIVVAVGVAQALAVFGPVIVACVATVAAGSGGSHSTRKDM